MRGRDKLRAAEDFAVPELLKGCQKRCDVLGGTNDRKRELLKRYFGFSSFRYGQEEVIDNVLSGRDVLCVMPTGAGKSVCYQIPALLSDGITVVISPLISLMKDQVMALVKSGVPAAFLNSSLTREQYSRALSNLGAGRYKIVYVAPERLSADSFLAVCRQVKISLIAVDEAHCVSQWGQDFRPSYLTIPDFMTSLGIRPTVGAFTATATQKVKEDIIGILKLRDPNLTTTGFDRPNLCFSVLRDPCKSAKLPELLRERRDRPGIVYCGTRKTVEDVCYMLKARGFSATRYHAGLSDEERKRNQEDFTFDRKTVMVATNAFGMGIDKPNIGFVIHYNMPKDLESYYQEAGRAGRDGEKAECILFYSPKDVHLNRFLINSEKLRPELTPEQQLTVQRNEEERLKQMTFYCTTKDCLRRFILRYFGENAPAYCGNCSNCLTEFETVDVTADAQKILSCIVKSGQRFGKTMICDVLRGSENKRVLQAELDRLSTYGILKDLSEQAVRDRIDFLIFGQYAVLEGDEYPVLRAGPKAREVLYDGLRLQMKVAKRQQKTRLRRFDTGAEDALFTALKRLRKEIADREGVPAYIIFSNATLLSMCEVRPVTAEQMLTVYGVGAKKLEAYGDEFLRTVRQFETSEKSDKK